MNVTDTKTDDQLIAQMVGRERRRVIWVTGVAVVLGVSQAVIMAQPGAAFGGQKIAVVSAVLTLGLGAMMLILWLTRRPRDPRVQGALLRRMDVLQRKRSLALLLFCLCTAAMSPALWRVAGDLLGGGTHPRDYLLLVGIGGLMLTMACVTLGRGGGEGRALFDDEFSRVLRLRAVFTAFGALFLGVIGLFVIGMSDPARAVQAAPLLLLYTVIVASFTYAVMDLLADRA